MPTVILVAAADRGHWQWTVPVAGALRRKGYNVELWTNECAIAWTDAKMEFKGCVVVPYLGDGRQFTRFIAAYKSAVSAGDTAAEGYEQAIGNGFAGIADAFQRHGVSPSADPTLLAATEEGRKKLEERLQDSSSLAAIVWERTWTLWVKPLADAASVPTFGLSPSFFYVYRGNAGEGYFDFEGEEKAGPSKGHLPCPGTDLCAGQGPARGD